MVSAVGFEPTSANTVELESTPLDRSGTLTRFSFTHQKNILHKHEHNTHTKTHENAPSALHEARLNLHSGLTITYIHTPSTHYYVACPHVYLSLVRRG